MFWYFLGVKKMSWEGVLWVYIESGKWVSPKSQRSAFEYQTCLS